MAGRDRATAANRTVVPEFARTLAYEELPADVVDQAKRCLLDLIGIAAGGARTPGAAIVAHYVATQLGGRARILLDGRGAGIAGAALAGASIIDALDGHDGHVLTKGHAGVAVLPALLAYIDGGVAPAIDGREFLTCLVLGYEIATRAGIALHATTTDYHCSGAWNALACAAIGGRLLGFDDERMRHALGAAEYFGPRGQILRACDDPSMVKDGSGWGAQVGVTAALLARDGFTGAPALTVEGDAAGVHWRDVRTRWRIREQYFKPYPVCRWAQPAIEAALSLRRTHDFDADDVIAISIESFREAIDLGSQCLHPATTDEAQYSLPHPVAAALVFGRVGAAEVTPPRLADPRVARLIAATTLREAPELSRRFPAERWASVRVTLGDGRTLSSEPTRDRGNPDNPLSDAELREKYRSLAVPVLGRERATAIETAVEALTTDATALSTLIEALLAPIDCDPALASVEHRRRRHVVTLGGCGHTQRVPRVARVAARDHHDEVLGAAPVVQRADVAEQALRARSDRECAGVKVERAARGEQRCRACARHRVGDAARRHVEQRAPRGMDRCSHRAEIGPRRRAPQHQQPRFGAEPERRDRIVAIHRIRRQRKPHAQHRLHFVGERRARHLARRLALNVPRAGDGQLTEHEPRIARAVASRRRRADGRDRLSHAAALRRHR